MSQRQLKLVSKTSRASSKIEKLSSVKCRMLRSPWSAASGSTSLQQKIAQLEQRSPGAAALIEKLVDDILAGVEWPGMPKLK